MENVFYKTDFGKLLLGDSETIIKKQLIRYYKNKFQLIIKLILVIYTSNMIIYFILSYILN